MNPSYSYSTTSIQEQEFFIPSILVPSSCLSKEELAKHIYVTTGREEEREREMVNCLARIPKYRAKKMIGEMKEIDAKENIRRYIEGGEKCFRSVRE
jgi:hypothetical protein